MRKGQLSKFLDCEVKDQQRRDILDLSSHDFMFRQIMQHTGETGTRLKVARKKLDQFGYIKEYGGVMNLDKRIKNRMKKSNLELATSLAEIECITRKTKKQGTTQSSRTSRPTKRRILTYLLGSTPQYEQ